MSDGAREKILKAYTGGTVAAAYIRERFETELNKILHHRQVSFVNRVVSSQTPERVLEIAPGPGRLTRDLRVKGTIICLEYNKGMIELGSASCSDMTRWVRGNAFQLPFSQVFDLVYGFRFVRHFHRQDRQELYGEISRVLRPGGYFVMDAVNERVSRSLRQAHPERYPVYDKLYRPDELRQELNEAGLNVVTLHPVQKYLRWQYRSQILLGPRSNRLNRLIIRTLEKLPGKEGLEWIVLCRRG
jgi:ubiquinone/menaquinone biosynthesis C-methylase UbiE